MRKRYNIKPFPHILKSAEKTFPHFSHRIFVKKVLKYEEKTFPHVLKSAFVKEVLKYAEKPFPHFSKHAEKVFPHILGIYEAYFFLRGF